MSQISPPDVPYVETGAFEWTKRAFEALTAHELTAEVGWTEGISSVTIAGPCPRCAHDLVDRQVGVVVAGVSGGDRRHQGVPVSARQRVAVDVTCGCGLVHDGAPDTVTGCGVSFRIEMTEAESEADSA